MLAAWGRLDGGDVVNEESWLRAQRLLQKSGGVEQISLQCEGCGRNELAADALAREFSALEQKHAGPRAGRGDGSGGARGAAADYGEVESGTGGWGRRHRSLMG